jgi:LasA protease
MTLFKRIATTISYMSRGKRSRVHKPGFSKKPVLWTRVCCTVMTFMLVLAACDSSPTPDASTPTPAINPTSPTLASTDVATGVPPTATPAPTPFSQRYTQGVAPTPDAPKPIRERGIFTSTYTIQRGDTLGAIALSFNVSEDDLRRVNRLTVRQANQLRAGSTLLMPQPVEMHTPSIKLIPDSELVNSPTAIDFVMTGYVNMQRGYLANYTEEVDGVRLTGPQVIQRVSEQFSVHPRLLLALLEYSSGWVTNPNPAGDQLLFPLGWKRTNLNSLYVQLNWAAVRLNEGYYGWRLDNRYITRLDDNVYVFMGNGINAGTAGLQNYLGAISTSALFTDTMGDNGFMQTYRKLFGDAWQYDIGPLVPEGLQQPALQLPWAKGETWYFTGGPHYAWARGTPWGALDFAPFSTLGCTPLQDWVTAMAEGRVVRSVSGEVVQSLDSRQDERAGWSVLYMHMGAAGRVGVGDWVRAGDRIGHPSCEGGVAPAAHLHIARKYNGEWVNADGALPFTVGGWVASEQDTEYDGSLKRDTQTREACECKLNRTNGVGW